MNPVDKHTISASLLGTPRKTRVIRKWLIGIFLVVLAGLFLPWQQNIQGYGKVTALNPGERPQVIPSIISGRIEKWYVSEGQHVEEGDTIVVITEIKDKFLDTAYLSRLGLQISAKESNISSKKQKIEALNRQINALQDALRLSLQKAQIKIRTTKLKVKTDSADFVAARIDAQLKYDQYRRLDSLYKLGLAPLTKVQERNQKYQEATAKLISAENKYNQSLNDLDNAFIEVNSIEADYLEKISKAISTRNETEAEVFDGEGSLAKLRVEYSNVSIRAGFYIIRAPQEGFIVEAKKVGIGETVSAGEEIITIMPDKPRLAIELYVKPVDLPLVYLGAPVRVQFDGWPALVFSGWPSVSVGTFGGKIQAIDQTAQPNGTFRMLVVQDSASEMWPSQIRVGTGAYGWTMLNDVPLWYELWRQLNSFPPDLNEKSDFKVQYKDKKIKEDDGDE